MSTPNCHRTWFFEEDARYGYSTYPSYKTASATARAAENRSSTLVVMSLRSRVSRFLEQLLQCLVPGGDGPEGLEPLEPIERVATDPEPSAVRKVQVHQPPPHGDREPERGLLVPGDRLGGEPGLAAGEHGAGEEQQQGDLPATQPVEVLGRGHLEVVAAFHRQVDLRRRPEAGDGRRHMGPQNGPERVTPSGRLAEQLVEPLLLFRRVAPLLRLDADLAAQRQGVDVAAVGLRHPQPEHEVGAAAWGSGRASTTSNASDGHRARRPHPFEEGVKLVMGLAAAVETPPEPPELPTSS